MSRFHKLKKAAAKKPESSQDDRRSKLTVAALGKDGDSGAIAFVALKYFRHDHQCFSDWSKDELAAFSDFNRKVSSQTWPQIIGSGGKGVNKAGLGCTPHDGSKLPDARLPADISEDIGWLELRVTQKARVHGFRAGAAFFLVFLDRNHEVFG